MAVKDDLSPVRQKAIDAEFSSFMYYIATCEQQALLSYNVHGMWIGGYK
jgi:hypothetical protein